MKSNKSNLFFYLFIILILGIFFCLYNYFNIRNNYNPIVFNSPDETANYFFATNFAKYNSLSVQNNALQISPLIHPRSIIVNGDKLIPISFIGLPMIYGSIAKIFGIGIIKYLTPFLAILGTIFFFFLIKEIFDRKTALISTLLLLITPAYWYYANKLMMHNILFIALLIMSLYFFVRAIKKEELTYWVLWGFTFALTVLTRLSEITWIALIFALIIIFNAKKIKIKKLLLGAMIFIITISPIFYFNKTNNGGYLKFSYIQNANPEISQIANSSSNIFIKSYNYLFPFGIHPHNVLYVFYNFILKLNWPYCLLLLLSLIVLIFKKHLLNKEERIYMFAWVFLSIYLFVYYGSLRITDDAILNSITIGSSYIRYLLPFFVFGIPIIAFALKKLVEKNRKTTIIFIAFLISIFSFWSYNIVSSSSIDSLNNIGNNIEQFKNLREKIINNTEQNSIIFVNRSDKFIFPYRNVVYLNNKNILNYEYINEFKNKNLSLYYFDDLKSPIESNDKIDLKMIFQDNLYYLYKVNIK